MEESYTLFIQSNSDFQGNDMNETKVRRGHKVLQHSDLAIKEHTRTPWTSKRLQGNSDGLGQRNTESTKKTARRTKVAQRKFAPYYFGLSSSYSRAT